jgi:hypothetical protein
VVVGYCSDSNQDRVCGSGNKPSHLYFGVLKVTNGCQLLQCLTYCGVLAVGTGLKI